MPPITVDNSGVWLPLITADNSGVWLGKNHAKINIARSDATPVSKANPAANTNTARYKYVTGYKYKKKCLVWVFGGHHLGLMILDNGGVWLRKNHAGINAARSKMQHVQQMQHLFTNSSCTLNRPTPHPYSSASPIRDWSHCASTAWVHCLHWLTWSIVFSISPCIHRAMTWQSPLVDAETPAIPADVVRTFVWVHERICGLRRTC